MMHPRDLLAVFVGGGLGSIARYVAGLIFVARLGPGFPYGTLCVNLVGCFLIGIVVQLAQTRVGLPPGARVFLTAGVLGGFTTFSTFAYDAVTLFSESLSGAAMLYVAISVIGGIACAFAGIALARAGG